MAAGDGSRVPQHATAREVHAHPACVAVINVAIASAGDGTAVRDHAGSGEADAGTAVAQCNRSVMVVEVVSASDVAGIDDVAARRKQHARATWVTIIPGRAPDDLAGIGDLAASRQQDARAAVNASVNLAGVVDGAACKQRDARTAASEAEASDDNSSVVDAREAECGGAGDGGTIGAIVVDAARYGDCQIPAVVSRPQHNGCGQQRGNGRVFHRRHPEPWGSWHPTPCRCNCKRGSITFFAGTKEVDPAARELLRSGATSRAA